MYDMKTSPYAKKMANLEQFLILSNLHTTKLSFPPSTSIACEEWFLEGAQFFRSGNFYYRIVQASAVILRFVATAVSEGRNMTKLIRQLH